MIFKGGTSLKKCYFGDYRFSEDLDFTALDGFLKGDILEEKINEAIKKAQKYMSEYATILVTCKRYLEKYPHPGGTGIFQS